MSKSVLSLKSEIDDLDHEFFGELWTIGGFRNVSAIKEEYPEDFEGIYTSVIELSIRKKDLQKVVEVDDICIRKSDGKKFIVRRMMPEIEDTVIMTIST
jgi:hypothetical protein